MPTWSEVQKEINTMPFSREMPKPGPLDIVRRKYLQKLSEKTKRNVIAYYSGFLQRQESVMQSSIFDGDVNAFMNAIHGLDLSKGLDLILHTPGGVVTATEAIVDYLHSIFGNDIRCFVPQLAMSGGTMIACSCRCIFMGKQSSIGPIDPQFGFIPAYGMIEEYLQKNFPKGYYQRASHVRENYQHIIVDVKFDGSKFRLRAGGPVYRQPLLSFNGPNGKVELLVPKLSQGFGCYMIDVLASQGPEDTIPIKVKCMRTISDVHWKFRVSGQFPKNTDVKDYAKQLTLDALDDVLERSIENLAKAHAALQQLKDK